MKEVNVIRKPIKIKVKDGNLTTAIKTLGENWTVEQGEDTQVIKCLMSFVIICR